MFIKEITSNGYCVMRAFQEGLLFYDYEIQLDDIKKSLPSEILTNYIFYSGIAPSNTDIIFELEQFIKSLLGDYCRETVDLFLIALGNLYSCKTVFSQ